MACSTGMGVALGGGTGAWGWCGHAVWGFNWSAGAGCRGGDPGPAPSAELSWGWTVALDSRLRAGRSLVWAGGPGPGPQPWHPPPSPFRGSPLPTPTPKTAQGLQGSWILLPTRLIPGLLPLCSDPRPVSGVEPPGSLSPSYWSCSFFPVLWFLAAQPWRPPTPGPTTKTSGQAEGAAHEWGTEDLREGHGVTLGAAGVAWGGRSQGDLTSHHHSTLTDLDWGPSGL